MTDDHYTLLYLRYTHHLNIHLRTASLTRRSNLGRTRTHERVDHQTWFVSHSSCSLLALPVFKLTNVLCYVLPVSYPVDECSPSSISETSSCSTTRRGLMTSISLGSPLSASRGWKKVSARCLDWFLNQGGEHRLMFFYIVSFLPLLTDPDRFSSLECKPCWPVFLSRSTMGSLPSQTDLSL